MTARRISRIRAFLEKRGNSSIQEANWEVTKKLVSDRRIDYYSCNKRKIAGWIIFKIFENKRDFQVIQNGKDMKENFAQDEQAIFLFQNRKQNWEVFFYCPAS